MRAIIYRRDLQVPCVSFGKLPSFPLQVALVAAYMRGNLQFFADCQPLCVEIIVAEPIFISIFLQVSLYHIIDIFFHCDII